MLQQLTLRNFKSFRDCTVEFGPLTLILGANASGKSNFFDALRFLQGCARGIPLNEILSGSWVGGERVWRPIRGGVSGIFNLSQGKRAFALTAKTQLSNLKKKLRYNYMLEVGMDNEDLELLQERLAIDDKEFAVSGLPGKGEGICASLIAMSVLPATPKEIRKDIPPFTTWLRDLRFLDLAPALMRSYVSKSLTEIGVHGENLSAVLYRVAADQNRRRTVLEWLRELSPQEISDFHFFESETADVLLAVREATGVTVSAANISDGTLRFLALIVALLTAKEGTTFVLEEIENGLHPSRLHLLVGFLEQVSASRNIQIIASTHSPYLLDSLSQQTLKNVLLFFRDSETQDSRVTRLVEIPAFTAATKSNPLDLLHASGWMEQNL